MSKKTKVVVFSQKAIEQLASYGLTPEIAATAGVSYTQSAKNIHKSHKDVPALIFRYYDLDGNLIPIEDFHRARYLWEGFQGQRYGQVKGTLNRVYLPPLSKESKITWREIANNPQIELLILEGEGKGLCVCTANRVPALALGGVDMWRALQSKGVAALYPLEEIVWTGRMVTIVYDSDNSEGLKESVHRAALALMNYLLGRGAYAFLCTLPPRDDGRKVAADDYIIEHGVEKFSEFVSGNRLVHASASRLVEVSGRYAYCRGSDCFVDKQAKNEVVPIDRERLNRILRREKIAYPELVPGNKQSPIPTTRLVPAYLVDALLSWPGSPQFDKFCYTPGEDKVVEKDGEVRFNLWTGWLAEYQGKNPRRQMPPTSVRDKMLSEYFWLLDNVFGEEPVMREFAEHWLFYPLKFPGAKLHQYMFVVSERQGIGKDLIAKLLIDFVYGQHGKHLRQTDIDKENRFNYHEYAVSLLWGDEVVTGSTKRFYESLKSVTTDNTLTVERKGLDPIEFDENHINRYLTANEFSFGSGIERREGLHRPGEGPLRDETRLTSIYKMFREYGGSPLLWYAREKYNEAEYAPYGDAPLTTHKRDARENVGDFLNIWLTNLYKSKDLNRPYFTSAEIWRLFRLENQEIPEHVYNYSGLPKRLSNLRYCKLFGGHQINIYAVEDKIGGEGRRTERVYVWSYLPAEKVLESRLIIEETVSRKELRRIRLPDPENGGKVVQIGSRKYSKGEKR